MQAPLFSLPDQNGNVHNLSDYNGKWVVLYFYPKDDTPGCTKEACSFRDNYSEFLKYGVQILGISKDSTKSHEKFATKLSLNFPLLSDPTLEIIKAYGSWGKKKFMGREFDGILRNTYLINPDGHIAKTYEGVKPDEHVAEVLQDIASLTSSS